MWGYRIYIFLNKSNTRKRCRQGTSLYLVRRAVGWAARYNAASFATNRNCKEWKSRLYVNKEGVYFTTFRFIIIYDFCHAWVIILGKLRCRSNWSTLRYVTIHNRPQILYTCTWNKPFANSTKLMISSRWIESVVRYLPGKCFANHRRPERKPCFGKRKFCGDLFHGKKLLGAYESNHPESKKRAFEIASGGSAINKHGRTNLQYKAVGRHRTHTWLYKLGVAWQRAQSSGLDSSFELKLSPELMPSWLQFCRSALDDWSWQQKTWRSP